MPWLDGGGSGAVGAKGSRSTAQSISSGINTPMQFDTEDFDDDSMIDLGVDNTRITAKRAGKAVAVASCRFAAHSTGRRIIQIWKNGAVQATQQVPATAAPGTSPVNVSWIGELAVGDYMQCYVYQDSGVSLNLTSTDNSLGVVLS